MDKFTVGQIRGFLHLSTKEMAEKLGMNPNTYGHKEEKGNWTLEELDPSDIYIYTAISHELETAKSNVKHLGKQINHLRGELAE